METTPERISSFVLISSIILSTLILMIYQYLTKLKGIRIRKEFLDNVLPIVNKPEPYDLSKSGDNFLVFTRNKSRSKRKSHENGILVPEQLLAHSFILNPVRLAILKILHEYNQYISSDLRKNLKITWGTYTPHVKSLIDAGMITSRDEFIDTKAMKILYLEDKGKENFTRLKSILQEIVI